MSGSRQQALIDARKLLRTFGSAPDPRRRAREILSELRRAEGWAIAARREIDATEAWLATSPSASGLEGRLRALLAALKA